MSDGFNQYKEIFAEVENNLQLKILPKLKMNMRSASTNISNLMDILIRKSLIKEDLYRYNDAIINKFELIEEKPISEEKKSEELFLRLKSLTQALNFLADNTPNSIDEMNDTFINNCLTTIEYFAFHNLSTASGINTKSIKEITDKAQGSGDEVFKRIMSDNLKLLIDSFRLIKHTIEEISKIVRTFYKAQIRFEIMPDITLPLLTEELFNSNQQKYIDNLNLFINANYPTIDFNRKWVTEAVQEYYQTDDVELISKISIELIGETAEKKTSSKTLSPRERLIALVFDLAGTKKIITDIYYDLDYNIKLSKNKELNFIEKLIKVMKTILNIEDDNEFIHIEYVNPSTKRIQKDTIKLTDFLASIKQRIKIFDDVLKPNSDANYKIKNGTNESLLKFLDTTYFSVVLLKERIVSLNAELRTTVSIDIKKRIKDLNEKAQLLDTHLNNIGARRRKFIIEQEGFSKKQ